VEAAASAPASAQRRGGARVGAWYPPLVSSSVASYRIAK